MEINENGGKYCENNVFITQIKSNTVKKEGEVKQLIYSSVLEQSFWVLNY